MPSTSTITSFYSFAPLTRIYSSEVNTNFSNYRGHIIPVDPSTATAATTITYDLGADDHAWRYVYAKQIHLYGDTTGATPPTGFYSVYVKSTDGKAYKKDSSGTESQLGGGALVVTGSVASPSTITAAGGISYTQSNGERQLFYLVGDTSTGTDITANPQITAGTSTSNNLEIVLYGTSDDNWVQLDDGNGLTLSGPMVLNNGSVIGLLWNGSTWAEMFRR